MNFKLRSLGNLKIELGTVQEYPQYTTERWFFLSKEDIEVGAQLKIRIAWIYTLENDPVLNRARLLSSPRSDEMELELMALEGIVVEQDEETMEEMEVRKRGQAEWKNAQEQLHSMTST